MTTLEGDGRAEMFYPLHMALSEREQRLLAEMEAALASDDPRLQSTLAAKKRGFISSPSLFKAIALLALGITTLFGGLIAQVAFIGIAGFILALAGVAIAITAIGAGPSAKAPRARRPRSSLSDRMQDRWDRRTFE